MIISKISGEIKLFSGSNIDNITYEKFEKWDSNGLNQKQFKIYGLDKSILCDYPNFPLDYHFNKEIKIDRNIILYKLNIKNDINISNEWNLVRFSSFIDFSDEKICTLFIIPNLNKSIKISNRENVLGIINSSVLIITEPGTYLHFENQSEDNVYMYIKRIELNNNKLIEDKKISILDYIFNFFW